MLISDLSSGVCSSDRHFRKVSAFWALAFLVPFTVFFGWQLSLYELLHVLPLEYLPFIILLLSLFTVAGGVRLKGDLVGSPGRWEEHTSELQSLMRISYAVFRLKKKKNNTKRN